MKILIDILRKVIQGQTVLGKFWPRVWLDSKLISVPGCNFGEETYYGTPIGTQIMYLNAEVVMIAVWFCFFSESVGMLLAAIHILCNFGYLIFVGALVF